MGPHTPLLPQNIFVVHSSFSRQATMSIWSDPSSKNAFVLSVVGLILETVAAVAGIAYYLSAGSILCLVFGLENCVDFLSSAVVCWRFYAPGKLTAEREEKLRNRELRASTAISFILILLGLGVVSTSSYDLKNGSENQYELALVIGIAFTSIVVFGSLTIFKFQYANKLDSSSLYKDGVCSLIGTVLAVALFINTLIIRANPLVWWLDPLVAMLCGFAALFFGMQSVLVLCKRGVPICRLSWWLMSRGDGDEDKNDPGTRPSSFDANSDLEMSENKANDDRQPHATSLSNEVV
jgi:Co/Zn/Cd efflux system component